MTRITNKGLISLITLRNSSRRINPERRVGKRSEERIHKKRNAVITHGNLLKLIHKKNANWKYTEIAFFNLENWQDSKLGR